MNRKNRRAMNRKSTDRKGPILQFKNVSEDTAELYLYGFIDDESFWGDEVTPEMVREKIATMGKVKNLNVYINSPGGSVFAGVAMYNILRRVDAYTTAYIDGACASAATYPAIACDKIVMPLNAEFMIHNSSACVCGNAEYLTEVSDMLKSVDKKIVAMYTARTGTSSQEIEELMFNETTMDAEEALAYGFIDEIDELKPRNATKKVINKQEKVEYNTTNIETYRKTLKDLDETFVDSPETPEEIPEIPKEPETPAPIEEPEVPETLPEEPKIIDYSTIENNIKLTESIIKSLGGHFE